MTKTKPEEFSKFHNALMSNAPEGYIPHYIPVMPNSKDVDVLEVWKRAPSKCPKCNQKWELYKFNIGDKPKQYWRCPQCKQKRANWKSPWSRLTFDEALERLKLGSNVGIAAMEYDPLCIIDIDNFEMANQMPDTLIIQSRKKLGFHGFCWWVE